jgi:hypothetical protein
VKAFSRDGQRLNAASERVDGIRKKFWNFSGVFA